MARIRVATNLAYDDVRGVYYATFNYGNGVKTVKTYSNKKQAELELKVFLADKAKGAILKPGNETLADWSNYWIEKICSPNAEETTVYGYKNILFNHIVPAMGKIELSKLTAAKIREYYECKLSGGTNAKPLSPNTLRKHHDVLRMVLDSAVQEELIIKNPMIAVKPPKTVEVEHSIYTPKELARLFELVHGNRLEIVVKLAGYYGLRREEICGLMWKDIDFEKRFFSINRSMTVAGGKIVIKPPKTSNSKRKQYMVDDIYNTLLTLKEEQDGYKKLLGDDYISVGFVLQWPDGKPYRPNYISELFAKFLSDNQLRKIKLHELRHTFASIANDMDVSLFDISKALGHGNTATTGKVYTHLFDGTNRKVIDRVAEAIQNMSIED